MKKHIIAKVLHFISFLIIYMLLFFSLIYFIDGIDHVYIAAITAALTVIIYPKIKMIKAQSGDKIQITWVFLKNPVLL